MHSLGMPDISLSLSLSSCSFAAYSPECLMNWILLPIPPFLLPYPHYVHLLFWDVLPAAMTCFPDLLLPFCICTWTGVILPFPFYHRAYLPFCTPLWDFLYYRYSILHLCMQIPP